MATTDAAMPTASVALSELAVVGPGTRDRAVTLLIDHLRAWRRVLSSASTNLVLVFSSLGGISLFCCRGITGLRTTAGCSVSAITYGCRHHTARSGRARSVARRTAGRRVTLVLTPAVFGWRRGRGQRETPE